MTETFMSDRCMDESSKTTVTTMTRVGAVSHLYLHLASRRHVVQHLRLPGHELLRWLQGLLQVDSGVHLLLAVDGVRRTHHGNRRPRTHVLSLLNIALKHDRQNDADLKTKQCSQASMIIGSQNVLFRHAKCRVIFHESQKLCMISRSHGNVTKSHGM